MITPNYQRGNVSLYLGDCMDILPHLPKVDAVVTDPPYSIFNKFGEAKRPDGNRIMQWSWDDKCSPEYVAERVSAMLAVCNRSSSFAVWCGSDQVGALVNKFREHRYTPKMMAWVKRCPPPAMKGNWWPFGFELGFYGYRNSPYFGDDDPKRCNVWNFDSYRHGQPGKVDHPTQKPLCLMEKLVSGIVPPRGKAIDGFMGSGTTGVACVRLGRGFIGIEKEPDYFEIACKRIDQEFDKLAMFEPVAPAVRQKEMFSE